MDFLELKRIALNLNVTGEKSGIPSLHVTVGRLTGLEQENIYAALKYATWRSEECDVIRNQALTG